MNPKLNTSANVDVLAVETRTMIRSHMQMQIEPHQNAVDLRSTCREPQQPVEERGKKSRGKANLNSQEHVAPLPSNPARLNSFDDPTPTTCSRSAEASL